MYSDKSIKVMTWFALNWRLWRIFFFLPLEKKVSSFGIGMYIYDQEINFFVHGIG